LVAKPSRQNASATHPKTSRFRDMEPAVAPNRETQACHVFPTRLQPNAHQNRFSAEGCHVKFQRRRRYMAAVTRRMRSGTVWCGKPFRTAVRSSARGGGGAATIRQAQHGTRVPRRTPQAPRPVSTEDRAQKPATWPVQNVKAAMAGTQKCGI